MIHPYLLNDPRHQPLLVMSETDHQPVITRLIIGEEELSSPTGYARVDTLLTFVIK